MSKKLRLILGDQLNENHSWFSETNKNILYVLMEVKSESKYVKQHIQKLLGFFASMRSFNEWLNEKGHKTHYIKISDKNNRNSFTDNIKHLIKDKGIEHFEYQEPDEYRLDVELKNLCEELDIPSGMCSSEHFLADRMDVKNFFKDKEYLMENFYRHMRKKYDILMDSGKPIGGKWNYDQENRKKLPKNLEIPEPYTYSHDLSNIYEDIKKAELDYFGEADPKNFIWPITRREGLKYLREFIDQNLENFGPYQDAMSERSWSNFHSRLSFALNLKMISPKEVIERVEDAFEDLSEENLSSVEGFIRQILGWREYMRGIYWAKMPEYENENYFGFESKLPDWYWTGETDMKCLQHSIGQSLKYAYAHHIQRLMITGNFALLIECKPDEVDAWYLGVYIDAIQWVEITNTRGMSQYADGGLLSSKPYISSANYVNKMSSYCGNCKYDHKKKYGENACPFNSLYWNFLNTQKDKLESNPRMGMVYSLLNKMDKDEKKSIFEQADKYLKDRNSL